jgi:hypothetical protein
VIRRVAQAVDADGLGDVLDSDRAAGVAVGGQSLIVTMGGVNGVTATASITVTAGAASATPVATAFASIATNLVPNYVVWSFDNQTKNWNSYDSTPGAPAGGLTGFSSGTIFWVQAASDCTLAYGGKQYTLYAGWNNLVW